VTAMVQFIPDFRRRISRPENRIDKNVRCPVCGSRALPSLAGIPTAIYTGPFKTQHAFRKPQNRKADCSKRKKRGLCGRLRYYMEFSSKTWSLDWKRKPSVISSYGMSVFVLFRRRARCQSTHAPMQMSEALSTSPSTK
jgi:hypothetical protein